MIAVGGALLAVGGAIAASPLLPFGVARRADPDPGLHADWSVLAPGALAVVAVVLAIAVVAALRSTRIAAPDRASSPARARDPHRRRAHGLRTLAGRDDGTAHGDRARERRSRGAASVGRVRRRVRRLRLERADRVRLESRAPVVDAASLRVDVRLQGRDHRHPTLRRHRPRRLATSRASRRSRSRATRDMQFAGRPTIGWALVPVKGTLGPAIVTGRAPRTPNEVALGAATMRALGKRVGDTVQTTGPKGQHVVERIVGQAVFPQLGDAQPVADGAWFTRAGWYAAGATNDQFSRYLVGTYAPHADRAAIARQIAARKERTRSAVRSCRPRSTGCARSIGSRRQPPRSLALLALVAVAHAVATSTRRRRRDLAVLKTIGFGAPTSAAHRGMAGDRVRGRRVDRWYSRSACSSGTSIWRAIAHSLGVRVILRGADSASCSSCPPSSSRSTRSRSSPPTRQPAGGRRSSLRTE